MTMKFPFSAATLATLALPFTATAAMAAEKSPVVLVHGAWETAEVWDKVEAQLKRAGYIVRNVSLPGRPGNPAPANTVTFASYQKTVASVVDSLQKPVILIGHSFGGFVISAEAEAEPAKIKTLVYVAAYLPLDGQSLLGLANTDTGSKAGPAIVVDKTKGIASIAFAARAGLFANDASPAVGAAVAKGIVDEPLAPLATPIHLTTTHFGSVDKVYIHTERDQVISPAFQAQMVAATPVRLEISLDTGHTPFITNPTGLVAAIEKATQ